MSFVEGDNSKQAYYKSNGKIITRWRDQIHAVCDCRYITLKPTNEFEEHNGGKTIKRLLLIIVDNKTEQIIHRLRMRKNDCIMHTWSCNACVNKWR